MMLMLVVTPHAWWRAHRLDTFCVLVRAATTFCARCLLFLPFVANLVTCLIMCLVTWCYGR